MSIPVQASASVQGEITLGGDLTGLADSAQLTNSGVSAGTYNMVARASVDTKGRLTAVGALTQSSRDALVAAGYATTPSVFDTSSGSPVLIVPVATISVAGKIQAGTNTTISGSTISIPAATTLSLGVAKVDGVSVSVASSIASVTSGAIISRSTGGTANGSISSTVSSNANTLFQASVNSNFDREAQWYGGTINGYDLTKLYPVSASNGTTISTVYWDLSTQATPAALRYFSAITSDGTNWTTKRISAFTTGLPQGMACDGTTFVMIGGSVSTSTIWTSTDGLSWTSVSNTLAGLYGQGSMTYGGGKFVIAGRNASGKLVLAVSSNSGATWSETTTTISVTTLSAGVTSICYDGTNFLVVSGPYPYATAPTRTLAYSTNGTTWVDKTASLPTNCGIYGIATDGAGTVCVAVATSSTVSAVYYSTDHGVTWANTSAGGIGLLLSIFWIGNKFMGFTSTKTVSSTTGTSSWSQSATTNVSTGLLIQPLRLSSTSYLFVPNSSLLGSRNVANAYNDSTLTTDNGSNWIGYPGIIPHEILFALPDSVGSANSSGTAPIGSKVRIVIDYPTPYNLEVTFMNTTARVKTEGGARLFAPMNQITAFTCVYTAANEWLVTKG